MNAALRDHRLPRLLLALLGLLAAGCRQAAPPPLPPDLAIDGDRALALAAAQVAIGPRYSGSPGAARTAAWIADRCRDHDYVPTIDTWTETTPAGEITFRNVYAELPGAQPGFILLASHYDTKYLADVPDFVGANDSASSTGLLLELMRATRAAGPWPGRTLRFAFFDGEEARVSYGDQDGLHGSRRLAAHYRATDQVKACRAMILLDMVGDRNLVLTLPTDTPQTLLTPLFAIAQRQGVRQHLDFARGRIHDDHVPFQQLGIPAIDLIDFDYGPNNSYWHTNQDTLDRLSPASLAIVGRLVAALVHEL